MRDIIIYPAPDGTTAVQLRVQEGTVWLTQAEMADLFQTTPQAITQLIKAIYAEGELMEAATCKESLPVRSEGKREVQRHLKNYNLEMILAVGYRVRFPRGTQFRQWATTNLREYLVKGMGLQSWSGSRVRKQDVIVAENYLKAEEVDELNRITVMFLDYAEDQAKRRKQLTLTDWKAAVGRFRELNERQVLKNVGTVSPVDMKTMAARRYETFDEQRRTAEAQEADLEDVKELEAAEKKLLTESGSEGE
jgi:hypothetical protein